MRISINTFKWYDRPFAAFIFFTRLPLWRIHQPSKKAYESVVEYWPLTGWLTGGVTAAVMFMAATVMPADIAIILALAARLMLTGALHEDGLADFFDAFGGSGNNRKQILDIMKDPHIGTYGVLALIVYAALLFTSLRSLGPFYGGLAILAADPFAKMVAGQITQLLPYARNASQSKAHNLYRRINVASGIMLVVQGLLPTMLVAYLSYSYIHLQPIANALLAVPCIVFFALYMLMLKKIKGYTGDCCGAAFLLVELSIYITLAAII